MNINFTTSRELPTFGSLVVVMLPLPARVETRTERVSPVDKAQTNKISRSLAKSLADLAPRGTSPEVLAFLVDELSKPQAPTSNLGWVVCDARILGSGHVFAGMLWERSEKECPLSYYKLGASLYDKAVSTGLTQVSIFLGAADTKDTESLSALVEGFLLAGYQFLEYRKEAIDKIKPKSLVVSSAKRITTDIVGRARTLVDATDIARDLVNLAPSDCSPAYVAVMAQKLAKSSGLKSEMLGEADLKKLGAGGVLGVGRASTVRPRLLKLSHVPGSNSRSAKGGQQHRPRLALVGKGVCFDSGGLSLKTSEGMEGMKMDMAGGAAVIAAMVAIANLAIPLEVHAYIPLVENMVSGDAMKPGDVLRMLSGKTVEVLNTDAEGRLILADALVLAEREGASTIVDLATLTGACVVALGEEYAGLFSNDEKLAAEIQGAAERSGERIWRLPLAPEYDDKLKSKIADIKNIGDRWGGAITAALFLQHFVTIKRWAHLDIAGPALARKVHGVASEGGSGFGVRTLVRFVELLARGGQRSQRPVRRTSKRPRSK